MARFDVHGRVGMHVSPDAPGAAQLTEMFTAFATEANVPADLEVVTTHPPLAQASCLEDELLYSDDTTVLRRADVGVQRTERGFRISGRGELLTAVVPLLDYLMVERGAAMIHAATVRWRGVGVALPAGGGTGKTSTIAKIMRLRGSEFLGDDWAFLDSSGTLMGFEKPLFIKAHHRDIYPQLFTGARKPLVPQALARPVARLTTAAHPHVVKYPRLAAAARRWSPEHRTVTFETAFPGRSAATTAPLGVAVFVERYQSSATRLTEKDTSWMVERLLGNFHVELAEPSRDLLTAMAATGLLAYDESFTTKRSVLQAALAGVPTFCLRVPEMLTADQASDDVVRHLGALLDDLGMGASPAVATVPAAQ